MDIDETAVRTANENASINKVGDRFTAVSGDLVDKVEGKYDFVVANIVADAIIALSASIGQFMKSDAVYIVSGIIDTRADDVKAAVADSFDMIDEYEMSGWCCFVLNKK